MSNTRKIIRAFLASPGDLQSERRAIREVVNEFNTSWADVLGYQVELIGWEETVAGVGRPQHLINQDLERCDFFIGMIWKRWGTPPDLDGDYSSGFEEEFKRSMGRYMLSGNPEISLFFKSIPEEYKKDPGKDLQKVLDFLSSIIAEKKILFQEFSTENEIQTFVRRSITSYVNRIKAKDNCSEADDVNSISSKPITEIWEDENSSSPLFPESIHFLESFVANYRHPDSLDHISASDVARFRLLANLVSKSGNDQLNFGVHDINILFAARINGLVLSERETSWLVRLAFQNHDSDNMPFWSWYSDHKEAEINPAVFSSYFGAENERIGAISILTQLSIELPNSEGVLKRELIIESWFTDNSSINTRNAALGYLAICGIAGDLAIARKEYTRNDNGTTRTALECMLGILLRTGQVKEAQELALESQFYSLNIDLLHSLLKRFEDIETSDLISGLEHRNPQIRLRTLTLLHTRSVLDADTVKRMLGDSYAPVRNEAISILIQLGYKYTKSEVKNILQPPKEQSRGGLFGFQATVELGESGVRLFQRYELELEKKLPEAKLVSNRDISKPHDDVAYFALAEKYFKNNSTQLRQDVDDRFSKYFLSQVQRMKNLYEGVSAAIEIIDSTAKLRDFICMMLTRRGLDVLCAKQELEDLQRIRANIRDDYTGLSSLDATYFARHGEWVDIPILVKARHFVDGSTTDHLSHIEIAKTINSIAQGHSVSDLMMLDMPAYLLQKVIETCSESRFKTITQEALLMLLNNESDAVRKAAAILVVRSFTVKRIKSTLNQYVNSEQYRYYNVIHWLDLGASMSRGVAKNIARC